MKKGLLFFEIIILVIGCSGCNNIGNNTDKTNEKLTMIEYCFEKPLQKWNERSIEIAQKAYPDFSACSALIDDEWRRCLYNEKFDISIIQNDSSSYSIYHGNDELTISMNNIFPSDGRVMINIISVGLKEMIYIDTSFPDVYKKQYIVDIDSLEVVNPIIEKECIFSYLVELGLPDYSGEYSLGNLNWSIYAKEGSYDTLKYYIDLIQKNNNKRLKEIVVTYKYDDIDGYSVCEAPEVLDYETDYSPWWY